MRGGKLVKVIKENRHNRSVLTDIVCIAAIEFRNSIEATKPHNVQDWLGVVNAPWYSEGMKELQFKTAIVLISFCKWKVIRFSQFSHPIFLSDKISFPLISSGKKLVWTAKSFEHIFEDHVQQEYRKRWKGRYATFFLDGDCEVKLSEWIMFLAQITADCGLRVGQSPFSGHPRSYWIFEMPLPFTIDSDHGLHCMRVILDPISSEANTFVVVSAFPI